MTFVCGIQGVGGAFVEFDDPVHGPRQRTHDSRDFDRPAPSRHRQLAVNGRPVLPADRSDPRHQFRQNFRRIDVGGLCPVDVQLPGDVGGQQPVVTVHESRVTSVQRASGGEVTSRLRRSIRPKRTGVARFDWAIASSAAVRVAGAGYGNMPPGSGRPVPARDGPAATPRPASGGLIPDPVSNNPAQQGWNSRTRYPSISRRYTSGGHK